MRKSCPCMRRPPRADRAVSIHSHWSRTAVQTSLSRQRAVYGCGLWGCRAGSFSCVARGLGQSPRRVPNYGRESSTRLPEGTPSPKASNFLCLRLNLWTPMITFWGRAIGVPMSTAASTQMPQLENHRVVQSLQ